MCKDCVGLVNEALNLVVRARKLDMHQRTLDELGFSVDPRGWVESGQFERHAARHNALHPNTPIDATRSTPVAPWVEEQYATDLADWEARARRHMMAEHEDAC